MAGGVKSTSKGGIQNESEIVAKKVVTHSRNDPTGDKFVKYLRCMETLGKSNTSRSRSPWTEFRTSGALEAIMSVLKNIFLCDNFETLTKNERFSSKDSNANARKVNVICDTALSILSNSFALDYSARSQAVSNGFIIAVQKFIAGFTQNEVSAFKNSEILERAVKCIANLSNDSHCRESVLKTGVAISILRILELADEKVCSSSKAETDESFVDKKEISRLISSCIRAVRILTSDSKFMSPCTGRDHLIRFGGIVTCINVLTWNAKISAEESCVLDVIRALTFLTLRIRSAPTEVINELTYNTEVCKLRCLVKIFENSQPDGKLYPAVIKCLINLSANKEISDCLGGLRIFHTILSKLDEFDEQHYHDLIKLLISLTKYSSFNQNHLVTSPLIGSTLKIFKMSRFEDYHSWLLTVYEKSYEVSLSKLVECDLVEHLSNILREELEDCDYTNLRKKISSLDDNRCCVHEDDTCPFTPMYRCTSPSYQKIQEEMKTKVFTTINEVRQRKSDDDSLSPFNSPSHYPSPYSSPCHSPEIHQAPSSDDEGCFSGESPEHASSIYSNFSPGIVSASDEEMELSANATDTENDLICRPTKRIKLEGNEADSFEASKPEERKLEKLHISVKKIVAVLNIIHKCTYITPFPNAVMNIAPVLLGIMLRGKISLMPQRVDYQVESSDDEFRDLSRKTFDVAYKILLKLFASIQTFADIIVTGIVPVIQRLMEPVSGQENEEKLLVVQKYCSNLISTMVGTENNTAGWREGYLMRYLLINEPSDQMNQMVLNIPLLYQGHPCILRSFERKAKSWSKMLDMLLNPDEMLVYRFEDCVLAICSICTALGVKWTKTRQKFQTLMPWSNDDECNLKDAFRILIGNAEPTTDDTASPLEVNVKLVLDDGTTFLVNKKLLIEASPYFEAVFNGHFMETDQQMVQLPNTLRETVSLLLQQISVRHKNTSAELGDSTYLNEISLTSLFGLCSLADRFLLEDIYERALNTMLTKSICPYSASVIYTESVKFECMQKSGSHAPILRDEISLNCYILKYILTAENLKISQRCGAMRKIFDSVVPAHVVKDLKTLIKHHMYKS